MSNFGLVHLALGKKYDMFKSYEDRVDIQYDAITGVSFIFTLQRPSLEEKREFAKNITVHLAMIDNLTHFLFEIGNMPVMDCSFHIKMQEGMGIPVDFSPLPMNQGYACRIILADANTGRIEHMRICSTTHEFAEFIRKEMIKQNEEIFDKHKYMLKCKGMEQKYPLPQMLLPKSVISFSHKRL